MVDSATKRWIRTESDESAAKNGCYFDEAAAVYVEQFFETFLRHSKGKWFGEPFYLMDWQKNDLIYPLFGWMRPDGYRRHNRATVILPKKQGKSTLAAGIGLYCLVGERPTEFGAEVFSVASSQQQASIVHNEAIQMVKSSPELSAVLKINLSNRNIVYDDTRSSYRALSAENRSAEGINASCLIIDELHIWRGTNLWNALKFSTRARRQGLNFVISTAGSDQDGVCFKQYSYAKQVISGDVIDERLFPYIREANPEDDWTQPETWQKANPSLGITIREEDFAADVQEAIISGPSDQQTFKRYSLNIWSSGIENQFLRPADWKACALDFDEKTLEGETCFGGLDLAKSRDMSAFVLLFPREDDEYAILPYFWLPEEKLTSKDSPAYLRDWAERGFIRTTPGNVCDYKFIVRDICELNRKFRISCFAFDPWNAESTTQTLEDDHGIRRVSFGQTIGNYAEPTSELERLVISGRLRHNDHPVMNWQAGHASVKVDVQDNKRPVKASGEKKIDGIISLTMALKMAMSQEYTPSVYEDRGVLSI